MTHHPEHGKPVSQVAEPGDELTGLHSSDIAWVGAIATLLMVVIIVATQAWFFSIQRDRREAGWRDIEAEGLPASPAARYAAEQEQLLSAAPTWADKDAGLASIPIERAMDLLVERGLPSE